MDGQLSDDLWACGGEIVRAGESLPDSEAHRNVARLVLDEPGETDDVLCLVNPQTITDFDIGSFSADVFVPQVSEAGDFHVVLLVHAGVPGLTEDGYWGASIGVLHSSSGDYRIQWGAADLLAGKSVEGGFPAASDTWYNLRLDITRHGSSSLRVAFYVDSELVSAGTLAGARSLLDEASVAWGPTRGIYLWRPEGDPPVEVFVDNVRAEFDRFSLSQIQPNAGIQGTEIEVTITGDGLNEDCIPFASPWGVSFVNVEAVDEETLTATAVIDEKAQVGDRDVRVWSPTSTSYSPAVSFSITENPQMPRLPYRYGLYDDFDGRGNQQLDGHQLAEEGVLDPLLWSEGFSARVVLAEDYVDDHVDHGNIVRFDTIVGTTDLLMRHPGPIRWLDYGSFSADFLVSSEFDPVDCGFFFDNHTAVPETPPGKSAYIQIGLRASDYDQAVIFHNNLNTSCSRWFGVGKIELDTWYNLRMDVVVVNDSDIRLDTFVDGLLRDSQMLCDGGLFLYPNILLDPKSFGGKAYWRHFGSSCGEGRMIAYVDNVHATYRLDD